MQKHKLILRLGGVLVFCFFNQYCMAQAEEISVKIKNIEQIHSQESKSDELYISITEFPALQPASHYQVPTYPGHWITRSLPNIKDVVLWKRNLNQCEPIDLLISLVEEDLPPWNTDDALGSVQLKVKCVDGKTKEEWVIPNPKITSSVNASANTFSFTGKGASYRIEFALENLPNEKKNQTQQTQLHKRTEDIRITVP